MESRFERTAWAVLAGLICFVVARFWFTPFYFGVWIGDDLSNFLHIHRGTMYSTIEQAVIGGGAQKYRPFYQLAWLATYTEFGTNFAAYYIASLVLHAVNAALVFLISWHLSGGARLASLLIAVAFTVSRFAVYQVLLITGAVLESVGLFFFLLAVLASVRSTEEPRQLSWAALWVACALFTHERYIGPVVAIGVIAALSYAAPIRHRLAAVAICVLAIAVNVGMKVVYLQYPFFVGTGGTQMSLSLLQPIDAAFQAIASSLGFNWGPRYLAGLLITESGWQIWAMAALFASGILGAAMICIFRKPMLAGILIGLAAAALAPTIFTIRFEFRWAYQPFVLALLLIPAALGLVSVRRRLIATAAACSLAIVAIGLEAHYRGGYRTIAFVSIGDVAIHAKALLATPRGRPLTVVGGPVICTWVLLAGEFFALGEGRRRDVQCVESSREASDRSRLRYAYDPVRGFVELAD